jgi:hypothetical protein
VLELNRAVAVGMAQGPEAGLALMDSLAESGALAGYHLLAAARADLLRRLGRQAADADPGSPWLAWGLYLAWQRGESRGWRQGLRYGVRRALVIVLSRHEPGDAVRYSEIIPLQQALNISAGRAAEVLQRSGRPAPVTGSACERRSP